MKNQSNTSLLSLLSLYYGTCLAMISHGMSPYFGQSLTSKNWTGIFYPLSFLNFEASYDFLFLIFVITTFLAIFSAQHLWARALHCICLLLLFSLFFGLGKGNFHSFHFFFYFSIFLIFIDPKYDLKSNQLALSLLSGIILLSYSTSGLWKMYELWNDTSLSHLYSDLGNTFRYHFAYAKAEGSLKENFLQNLLMQSPLLSAFSWASVIALEAGSFIPLLSPRHFRHWTLMMTALHLMVGLMMGIWFYSNIILLFILLVFRNEIIKSKT